MADSDTENTCTGCDAAFSEMPDDDAYNCAFCEDEYCEHCMQTTGSHAEDLGIDDEDGELWFCENCVEDHKKGEVDLREAV